MWMKGNGLCKFWLNSLTMLGCYLGYCNLYSIFAGFSLITELALCLEALLVFSYM